MKCKIVFTIVLVLFFFCFGGNAAIAQNQKRPAKQGAPKVKIKLTKEEKAIVKMVNKRVRSCVQGKEPKIQIFCNKKYPRGNPALKNSNRDCVKIFEGQTSIECTKTEVKKLPPKLYAFWKQSYGARLAKQKAALDKKKAEKKMGGGSSDWMTSF